MVRTAKTTVVETLASSPSRLDLEAPRRLKRLLSGHVKPFCDVRPPSLARNFAAEGELPHRVPLRCFRSARIATHGNSRGGALLTSNGGLFKLKDGIDYARSHGVFLRFRSARISM